MIKSGLETVKKWAAKLFEHVTGTLSKLKRITVRCKQAIMGSVFVSTKARTFYLMVIMMVIGVLMYRAFDKQAQSGSVGVMGPDSTNQHMLKTLHNHLENRLTATEAHLQRLEGMLASVGEKIGSLATCEQLAQVHEEVGVLTQEHAQELERMKLQMRAMNELSSTDDDGVIKQAVAEQVDSLRKEIKQREKRQRRKTVMQRFLDQLSNEDD